MRMRRTLLCFLLCLAAGAASNTYAQQVPPTPPLRPGTIPPDDAATISHGWAMLSQGNLAEAAGRAEKILNGDPRNVAALMLAVEAQISGGGATAGLDQYERWLGQRTIEEAGVLRRIARAVLREQANQRQDAGARADAIRALVDDRDATVRTELEGPPGGGATRMLAESGDEKAVSTLIAQLKSGLADPVLTIQALGRSGSRAAIAPIVERLGDAQPEVRGTAAEALGHLDASDQVKRLQAMLADQSAFVRVKAAGALFVLGNDAGLPLLRDLMDDESAASRLVAAEAMASRPDVAWLDLVRGLTGAAEPEVQVAAAKLLAPHDPHGAGLVIERLGRHENIAIRELAATAQVAVMGDDLGVLRQLMRNPDRRTRVAAGTKVLVLTR
jgi:HEAT repeat protein